MITATAISSTTMYTKRPQIVQFNHQLRRAIATYNINPKDDNILWNTLLRRQPYARNRRIIRRKYQSADTSNSDEAQTRSDGALSARVYLYRNRNFRFQGSKVNGGKAGGGVPPGGRGMKNYFLANRSNLQ